MKWYQAKEQAAGVKRLFVLYYIHKIFGRNFVKFIVFFVTFFAFWGAKKQRQASAKYLKIIGENSSIFNQYRHFLEYSFSLLDRMEVFSGRFDVSRISFADEKLKKQLDIDSKNGIFFICSHLGNIDVMRAMIEKEPERKINAFVTKEQCKIFNGFIKAIEIPSPVTAYPIEEIGVETSIELKDKLSKGEFVIMAGDRTSKKAQNFKTKLFGREVEFPLGTFKFAQLMEAPIYFVCIIKSPDEKYKIYLQKFNSTDKKSETLKKMQTEYVEFLEKYTKLAPFQFYHFYDMFS